MRISNLILAAAMVAAPIAATAQTVTQRQYNEQQRINQGVRSGELTRHETRNLERGQMRIQREKRAMASDGYLSRGERAKLRRDQNRQSARIYRERRDGQYRRF